MAGIEDEVDEGCVGLGDDRKSKVVVVTESVLESERDEKVKEGEVERNDVEVVNETGVDNIPE